MTIIQRLEAIEAKLDQLIALQTPIQEISLEQQAQNALNILQDIQSQLNNQVTSLQEQISEVSEIEVPALEVK